MSAKMTTDRYLSTTDLAERTGFSADLFQRLAREGKIPFRRKSWRGQSAFLFDPDEFAEWWATFVRPVVPTPPKGEEGRTGKRCWDGLPIKAKNGFNFVQAPITGRVYFAACEDMIKIGYTKNTRCRLSALSAQSYKPVVCIGTMSGSHTLEAYLKYKFSALNSHGEWFYAKPPIIDFIKGVARINDAFRERYE